MATPGSTGTINLTEKASPKVMERFKQKSVTDGLYSKEYTYPVTCNLEILAGRVGRVPYRFSNGTCSIIPHIEECRPTEELYQAYLPERRWCLTK